MADDLICVGAIVGAFGVQGDVRIKSFTAIPEDITSYPLSTEDGARRFELTLMRPVKHGFAGRLSGVMTKEQADALRGVQLFTKRDALPTLPDDEFYHADLIDLEVYDTGGALLGRVKSVQNHGAADLLELHGPNLKSSVFLPFTKTAVPTVDLAAGRIVADPPEGLL